MHDLIPGLYKAMNIPTLTKKKADVGISHKVPQRNITKSPQGDILRIQYKIGETANATNKSRTYHIGYNDG